MTIQRATTLYPVNTTTVDTGVGIDIRLLDSAEAGADDDTQSAQATHTQDNVERTYDPATASVTNTNNAATTLFKTGWALRLTEDMTPGDNTNCNAFIPAGTLTVNLRVAVDQSGGTYVAGSYGPTWRAALWEYDPSTDTGSVIQAGSDSSTTWNYTPATGDLGTFKTVSVSIVLASSYEFTQGSILLLQVGLNTGTIPNPSLGTATWTYTLRVDNANTAINWAASQGIRQACAFSNTAIGVGTSSRVLDVGVTRTPIGVGTTTYTKAVTASKTFSLVGDGTVTHTKAATKTATVVGVGEILTQGSGASTITIPIDEVPTGGGGTTNVYPIFPVFD